MSIFICLINFDLDEDCTVLILYLEVNLQSQSKVFTYCTVYVCIIMKAIELGYL